MAETKKYMVMFNHSSNRDRLVELSSEDLKTIYDGVQAGGTVQISNGTIINCEYILCITPYTGNLG